MSDPKVEQRIELIAQEMREMRWNNQRHKALAIEWDLSPGRIRHMSAEASRRVKAEAQENSGQLTVQIYDTLQHAMQRAREYDGLDESKMLQAGVQAAALAADIVGIKAPKQVEATINGLADLFAELQRHEPPGPVED